MLSLPSEITRIAFLRFSPALANGMASADGVVQRGSTRGIHPIDGAADQAAVMRSLLREAWVVGKPMKNNRRLPRRS